MMNSLYLILSRVELMSWFWMSVLASVSGLAPPPADEQLDEPQELHEELIMTYLSAEMFITSRRYDGVSPRVAV